MWVRRFRLFILLLIAIGVAWNILYFQDPWLWRRFTSMFTYMVGGQSQVLSPSEPVASDGTYILDVADPEEQTIEPLALTALNNYAASFDSYALVVLHKGKIQTEWYAPGFNQESLTQSQSMHKTVVAILIGKAIEEGLIESIDDPVGRYVKEWENDPRGNITLYELLIMSSGLAQYDFTLNPFADDFRWLYSGDTQQYVLKTPLADWQPGSRFDYNNINAELLGTVLEQATGRRYAEYLEEKLWRPLGGEDARVWLDSEFGNPITSCCLMATARDWARVGQMMLNRGQINGKRVVSESWVARMIEPSPVSKWYGLQTWLAYEQDINPRFNNPTAMSAYSRREPFLAADVYYLSGRGAQRVYVVPSHELVIVRLGPALGPNPLKPGWDNAFLVNSAISGIK